MEQDTLDPVLSASFTSFRTKHDINAEIDTSSETLKLGRNKNLVFHRDTVADQVAVTRKALHTRRSLSRTAAATPWQEMQEVNAVVMT